MSEFISELSLVRFILGLIFGVLIGIVWYTSKRKIVTLMRDAKRYRWLRDHPQRGHVMEGCYHKTLDDAIDTAIRTGCV